MRFPIDVVFVDREQHVVKVAYLPPFRASSALGEAHAAIELPSGVIEQSRTAVGDALKFEG